MQCQVSTYHGPECERLADFDFVFEDEDTHFAGDEGVEVKMLANRIPPMATTTITTAVMQAMNLPRFFVGGGILLLLHRGVCRVGYDLIVVHDLLLSSADLFMVSFRSVNQLSNKLNGPVAMAKGCRFGTLLQRGRLAAGLDLKTEPVKTNSV